MYACVVLIYVIVEVFASQYVLTSRYKGTHFRAVKKQNRRKKKKSALNRKKSHIN